MPLWAYTFEEIEKRHIEQLDANDIPENHRIEFKRDAYPSTEGGSKEFLKDISAFANLSGGHLIVGMDEKATPGLRLVGIEVEADKEIARLENIARTGLEPRVTGIRIKSIALDAIRSALIVRIPRSWSPPHRVTVGNSNRFYIRNSNGAHEMSLQELRAAFTLGSTVSQSLTEFRLARVQKIRANESEIRVQGPSRLVVHIVPLSAFSDSSTIDMTIFQDRQTAPTFWPLTASGMDTVFNFDGVAFLGVANEQGYRVYTQLYRTGIVEAVVGNYVHVNQRGDAFFHVPEAEGVLLSAMRRYVKSLVACQIYPPYAVMLSVLGAKGAMFRQESSFSDPMPLNRDELLFAPAILETATLEGDWAQPLRPVADALWNAFGYMRSLTFDKHMKSE